MRWCQPGAVPCDAYTGYAGTLFVENTGNGAVIMLTQPATGLQRAICIASGGRVRIVTDPAQC